MSPVRGGVGWAGGGLPRREQENAPGRPAGRRAAAEPGPPERDQEPRGRLRHGKGRRPAAGFAVPLGSRRGAAPPDKCGVCVCVWRRIWSWDVSDCLLPLQPPVQQYRGLAHILFKKMCNLSEVYQKISLSCNCSYVNKVARSFEHTRDSLSCNVTNFDSKFWQAGSAGRQDTFFENSQSMEAISKVIGCVATE